MAASEADPEVATGASLTSVIEVSSSTVEEEKTEVSPFGSASTVDPLREPWRSHRPVVWSESLECR